MSNFIPYTLSDLAKAEANGFVLKTGRVTLMTHPRYPGWLFKLVPDIESALSCGGLMMFGVDSTRVAYFGRTAMNAASTVSIGTWLVPSTLTVSLDAQVAEAVYNSSTDQYYNVLSVTSGYESFAPTFGGSAAVIGVISKATAGFMVDTGTPSRFNSWANSTLDRVGVPLTAVGPIPIASEHFLGYHVISSFVSTVSGFISYDWNVNKRVWLSGARAEFLAGIENNDVKSAYNAALSEVITTTPPGDVVSDGLRLTFGLVGDVVEVCFGSRPCSQELLVPVQSPTIASRSLPPGDPVNGNLLASQWGMTTEVLTALMILSDGELFDDTQRGRVVPACHMQLSTGEYVGAGAFGERGNPTPWFSPNAVPYSKFIMTGAIQIPLSGIFASMFPGSKPSVAAWSELPAIDLTNRVPDEVAGATGVAVPRPFVSGNLNEESVVSQAASDALRDIKFTDSRLLAASNFFTPFSRFVVRTSLQLDSLARDGLN